MISSLSGNIPAFKQADYSQHPPLVPANDVEQKAQQNPELKATEASPSDGKKNGQLSDEELKVVRELKQRDSEVRAHEAAHLAAAGGIAVSGASFSYQQGPDGIRYAIGGEVSIDTSGVPGDPAATLRKADTIRRAALAPAEPSGQDMQVAANATAMAAKAQAELFQKNQDNQNGNQDRQGTQIDLSV
ncbi:MAG: putative metalloprotease CJM1_0395 family protein [Methylobacter sp.]|nr:putative metalloprotease CJM1_0395 family protein [Methylobacter sp.]MDP2429152.1 putative metalloprotease CJM1_0395 family protein [Methylobacter sp.]MDP3053381.1 putative metalloprotease CJM1_0395 family protein [Methylobacter sp.]MDP3360740.1 putative metalloprotease CJM1_0395 family protein [Methylobacter sp.]MDZ4218047.1 putative metalloprotease CJM1_0395 family protein [Methylobacter sp.]